MKDIVLLSANNSYFIFIFFIFLLLATIERARATFPDIQRKEKLYEKKDTFIASFVYILIILGSITEYFLIKRRIIFFVSLIGCTIYLVGSILRNNSIRSLGKLWSIHSDATHVNNIIRLGPYKYVRHPYYLSVILELLGISIVLNSYYSIAAIFIIQLPIILTRIYFEEKQLINKFGQVYIDLKQRTPLLFTLRLKH